MQIRTTSTIYNRPPTCNSHSVGKSSEDTISMLTNELQQLENEKRIVELKISSVERKIFDVQSEITSINDTLTETREYVQRSGVPSRLRHITMKY